MREGGCVCLEEIDRGLETILHVHHRELAVLAQEAVVLSLLEGRVKDVDGVIGRACNENGAHTGQGGDGSRQKEAKREEEDEIREKERSNGRREKKTTNLLQEGRER